MLGTPDMPRPDYIITMVAGMRQAIPMFGRGQEVGFFVIGGFAFSWQYCWWLLDKNSLKCMTENVFENLFPIFNTFMEIVVHFVGR